MKPKSRNLNANKGKERGEGEVEKWGGEKYGKGGEIIDTKKTKIVLIYFYIQQK